VHLARPPSLNTERREHWSARASSTATWRQAFWALAKKQRIPTLGKVTISVEVESANRRLADCGACWPSIKGAVDGLVDAGVLDDDGPSHVLAVTLHAPRFTGRDALVLVLNEATEGAAT